MSGHAHPDELNDRERHDAGLCHPFICGVCSAEEGHREALATARAEGIREGMEAAELALRPEYPDAAARVAAAIRALKGTT